MVAVNSVQQPLHKPAAENDPFLRKNQTWFHQPLSPSIEKILFVQKKHGGQNLSENHLDGITARVLDPYPIERKQLVPRSHAEKLQKLHTKIRALDNQISERQISERQISERQISERQISERQTSGTKKLTDLIQNEILLARDFYAQRVMAAPC